MVKINSFIGWLSDTDTRMGEWQFPYAENINIFTVPQYAQLAFVPTDEWDTTSSAKRMYCSLYAKTSSVINNVFFMWEGWYIFNKVWANVETIWFDISACHQFTIDWVEYIIFAYDWSTSSYLWITSVSDAYNSADWSAESSYDDQYKTLAERSDEIHLLEWNNALYVAWDKTIWRLSPSGNFETVMVLWNNISWLTDNWTHIRVYTVNGMMHIRDWGSNTPQASINTWLSTVRWAFWVWQQDWLLWGKNNTSSTLHMSDWYAYPMMKRGTDLLDEYDLSKGKYKFTEWNTDNNFMTYHQWVYWIAEDDWLFQFGKFFPSSPFAFNKILWTAENGEDIAYIWALCRAEDELFFFVETDNYEWIQSISIDSDIEPSINDKVVDSWSMFSPKFLMGNVSRIAFELYMRADIPEDTTIVVKYAIDWSGTWVTLATLTDNTDKRHILSLEEEFNEIQFKFTLSTTDTAVTPKIYEYEFIPWPLRREWVS